MAATLVVAQRDARARDTNNGSDDAPLLIHADGSRVRVEEVPLHLRRARLTRVNAEANGSMCRGMLRDRYATRGQGEIEERS